MRKLLLVKHALPIIDPEIPSREWQLGEDGQTASRELVQIFKDNNITRVITSDEAKAMETGQIPAKRLNLPYESRPNLHEHDRTKEPFVEHEVFLANVRGYFDQPDVLVFGAETASRVYTRFAEAVTQAFNDYPQDNLAIVAHGTVITTFVANHNDIDTFNFWDKLTLPSVVRLRSPDFTLIDTITDITGIDK